MQLHPSPRPFAQRRARRGSILLLVLALLSVLALMATTLLYASKLESLAASNASRSVQNRLSTATGVPFGVHLLDLDAGKPTAYTQRWANTPSYAQQAFDSASSATQVAPWPAWIDIRDQSACININAIADYPTAESDAALLLPAALPAATLEKALARQLVAQGLPAETAPRITESILRTRREFQAALGVHGDAEQAPGRPVDRDAPRAFQYLDDLRALPEITPAVFEAIAPLLTPFSASLRKWQDSRGREFERLSLNQASFDQILGALLTAFPAAEENDLAQFTLNLLDRRDPDNAPSVYQPSPEIPPLLGYEETVVISEVCPDVITFPEDNDNGEYIEFFNPTARTIDLSGWRVDWGTGQHILDGRLGPGACLVLTDDIDDSQDPTPEDQSPGMGNFTKIFRAVAGGINRIDEEFAMDIPDYAGIIQLLDGEGNLVDFLEYSNARFNGAHRGWHKTTAFSHIGRPAAASPFQAALEQPVGDYQAACLRWMGDRMNAPFQSPAELLTLPFACEPLPLDDRGALSVFPRIEQSDGTVPDATLLDLFSLDAPVLTPPTDGAAPIAPDDAPDAPDIPSDWARINLNTASLPILESLPGLDADLAARIRQYRDQIERELAAPAPDPQPGAPLAAPRAPLKAVPFRSLADFATTPEVWGTRSAAQRLQSCLLFSNLVACHSTTFLVTSTREDEPTAAGRSGSVRQCQALVQLGRRGADLLDWRFLR